MTPDEQIKQIKELEQQFLIHMDEIRKKYTAEIKEIIADVEKKKIDALKKDLGI
jgi:hypothetical protein